MAVAPEGFFVTVNVIVCFVLLVPGREICWDDC